jgi:hypothetical protein
MKQPIKAFIFKNKKAASTSADLDHAFACGFDADS